MKNLLSRTLDIARYMHIPEIEISNLYFQVRSDLAQPTPLDVKANLLCKHIAVREVYITFENAFIHYMNITPPNLNELKGDYKKWWQRIDE